MSRASIRIPKKPLKQRQHNRVEERPVLQLPLQAPRPTVSEPEPRDKEKQSDRGVAVVDFYI